MVEYSFRELSSVHECPHRERSTDSTLVKAIVIADLCISERFLSKIPDLIHYHPKTPNITGHRVLLVVYCLQFIRQIYTS